MMEALRSLRFRIALVFFVIATLIWIFAATAGRNAAFSSAAGALSDGAQKQAQVHVPYAKGEAAYNPQAYLDAAMSSRARAAIIVDETPGRAPRYTSAQDGDFSPCNVKLSESGYAFSCTQRQVAMGVASYPIDSTHRVIWLERYESSVIPVTMAAYDDRLKAGLGAVALSGLVGWFAAGAVQRPVSRAALATRAIAGGNLKLRLPTGRDAFGRLSRDVNTMVDELERKIAGLEASERRQRELLADVAHELRTPMTALLASADALEDPSTRDEAAAVVAPQLRRLAVLTEDVLEMSQLDSGTSELRLDRVSLAALAYDASAGRAQVWSTGDTSAVVDPRRVHAIVRNLIDNAARHGAPPITCDVTGTEDDVVVTVTDAGPGVPPSQRERVFDRFVRGDSARSGGGSGLGLAIARENARLHGGDLRLRDDGRTFELRLPREAAVTQILPDLAETA